MIPYHLHTLLEFSRRLIAFDIAFPPYQLEQLPRHFFLPL